MVEGLCPKCLSRELSVIELPPRVVLTRCRFCGAVKSGGRWLNAPEAVKHEIIHRVRVRPEVRGRTLTAIPPSQFTIDASVDIAKLRATVTVKWSAADLKFSEQKTVALQLRKETCPGCLARRGQHYEAVIQLRDGSGVSGFLDPLLREAKIAESARDFVVRIEKVRNGWDIYVSSVRMAKRIAAFLRRRGLSVKVSRKLVGQTRDGIRLYRFTYLARAVSRRG